MTPWVVRLMQFQFVARQGGLDSLLRELSAEPHKLIEFCMSGEMHGRRGAPHGLASVAVSACMQGIKLLLAGAQAHHAHAPRHTI